MVTLSCFDQGVIFTHGTSQPLPGRSAALRGTAEMVNQRLQFGPFRGQQGFAVEGGGKGLVFGGHAPSLSVHGPRKSEPSARVLPPGQLRRRG